jgi:hypothetical protein
LLQQQRGASTDANRSDANPPGLPGAASTLRETSIGNPSELAAIAVEVPRNCRRVVEAGVC